jgi:hypothetical protein
MSNGGIIFKTREDALTPSNPPRLRLRPTARRRGKPLGLRPVGDDLEVGFEPSDEVVIALSSSTRRRATASRPTK